MIKYLIDSVARENKDTEDHVVYVKVYDDAKPDIILTQTCVAYRTKEQFEADLEKKTKKYQSSVLQAEDIKILAQQSISAVEIEINDIKMNIEKKLNSERKPLL